MHVQRANQGMQGYEISGGSNYFELDGKDTTKWVHAR